jgi:hypothetical protein
MFRPAVFESIPLLEPLEDVNIIEVLLPLIGKKSVDYGGKNGLLTQ